MDRETVKLTVRIPASYLQEIDFLVEAEDFPSRSEVIRTAVRDLVNDRLETVIGNLERKKVVWDRMSQLEELKKKYLSK